jgi:hypothetical protein
MDIENCNIPLDVCSPINQEDELADAMHGCTVQNQPFTIYISELLGRLTRECVYEKVYDVERGEYILNIKPPTWYYSLEEKYQLVLIRLLEPVFDHYLKKN